MPFAILWGVDLPFDLSLDLSEFPVAIYQCESQIAIFLGESSAIDCQVSVLTVGIYRKLPFAILWGVDLPVDLPLDLPDISSHSRNLLENAICYFMGVVLPVDLP